VFWAHASNFGRLEQSYREIADLAKVRGRKDPQADIFKLVHDWLRNEKNGPWLLVIDNADDAAVLSPPSCDSQNTPADNSADGCGGALRQHLSRYLPASRHGSVLVTSRTRRAAMQVVEESDIIPIEPMHNATAYALLRKKLRDNHVLDEDVAALATELDHMPLALVQAASYIRAHAPRCSVQRYLEKYRSSDKSKTSLLNREAGNLRRDGEASNSVILTWQISFEHVRTIRKSAADLLSLMSFFDRQGIHESLLRNHTNTTNKQDDGGNKQEEEDQDTKRRNNNRDCDDNNDDIVSIVSLDDRFEDDILTLRDYSFITVTSDAATFEMHSLIQLAMRKWLENENQLDRWRAQFIVNLCAEFPGADYENWPRCRALFPHARAAVAQRPRDRVALKSWALLLNNAATYAWEMRNLTELERMSAVSVNVIREIFGEESVLTWRSMDLLGFSKNHRNQWKEAESIHRQTLVLVEKVLGPEHPYTLSSMSNLGATLKDQGKHIEAELIFRQTLARRREVLGLEHPNTLSSMNNLGATLSSQGKHNEAELIYRQTLAGMKKVLGPDHPETLKVMPNLALCLKKLKRYDEALTLDERVCAASQTVLGPDHPNTLRTMSNLATILFILERYDEALAILKRVCTAGQNVLGPDHPHYRICCQFYNSVLAKQERIRSESVTDTHRGKRKRP
jgi:tetratricopeptide (TPR) repeat protein